MQIHRDGRFAVKFQGLPRRNSTLYLHLHFHLLALRAVFSLLSRYYLLGAAAFFPKLYELSALRSSQLLCWELTGQHPISNKACRSCSCLTPTHLRFHPRESPILSSCRNCISNFRRHTSSYVFLRFKAGFCLVTRTIFSIHHQLKEITSTITYLISLALLQLITLSFLFLFSLCLFNFYFADRLIFFHTKIYFLAAP